MLVGVDVDVDELQHALGGVVLEAAYMVEHPGFG